MTIEINQRLYEDFISWAKANNMSENDIDKYFERAFREKFMLDKYGDLNDKIVKKKTTHENGPKNELNYEIIKSKNNEIDEVINVKPKRKTKVIQSK